MKLKIYASTTNTYPLAGLLVRGNTVDKWIHAIQEVGLSLEDIEVYAMPDTTPNSVWGCFIKTHVPIDAESAGRHTICQKVTDNFFIPEQCAVLPVISAEDASKLFSKNIHVFHSEFGMVETEKAIDFSPYIVLPECKEIEVTEPQPSIHIPNRVLSFRLKETSLADSMKDMEENLFPKKEKMPNNKPLNILEKLKLGFYNILFKRNLNTKNIEKKTILKKIQSAITKLGNRNAKVFDNMQEDYQNLESRNRKEVDKLLDMLENNPEEAIKYAIPIDDSGTGRGSHQASYTMSRRWSSSSLFSHDSGTGGGSVDLGDQVNQLTAQYNKSAEELLKQGKYDKAAFVYMKLLKNYWKAADTLQKGKYYKEAGTIFEKYVKNKEMAASCYEKGYLTERAIELYTELHKFEKVGDLYSQINKLEEAKEFYNKEASRYLSQNKFLLASKVYKDKTNELEKAQEALLIGWDSNKDEYNCLYEYFSNVSSEEELKYELDRIYREKVPDSKKEKYLKVLRRQYKKNSGIKDHIKEMAFSIISEEAVSNPAIVSNLSSFIIDNEISKDVFNYKVKKGL